MKPKPTSPNGHKCSVKEFDRLKSEMDAMFARLSVSGSKNAWRKIAAVFNCSPALAWLIVNKGYEPKRAGVRERLNLPPLIPTPACRWCGQAHPPKRCPDRRKAEGSGKARRNYKAEAEQQKRVNLMLCAAWMVRSSE